MFGTAPESIADLCTFIDGGSVGSCMGRDFGRFDATSTQALQGIATFTVSGDRPTFSSTTSSASSTASPAKGPSAANPSRTTGPASSGVAPPSPTASRNAGGRSAECVFHGAWTVGMVIFGVLLVAL